MKFTINAEQQANIKALGTSFLVMRYLTKCGRLVKTIALASSPPRGATGRYASSFDVRPGENGGVTVIADDRKAVWLEYGTGRPGPTPHFLTLTKATKSAGFARVVWVKHVLKGGTR